MEEQVQITTIFTHNCFWKIIVHYSIFFVPDLRIGKSEGEEYLLTNLV